MRYDKDIYFVRSKTSYNAETGDYEDENLERDHVKASVMDTSDTVMTLVYGRVMQGSLTIHLQNHYDGAFDLIEYNGRRYAVDRRRRLRVKDTFVVSEVQYAEIHN